MTSHTMGVLKRTNISCSPSYSTCKFSHFTHSLLLFALLLFNHVPSLAHRIGTSSKLKHYADVSIKKLSSSSSNPHTTHTSLLTPTVKQFIPSDYVFPATGGGIVTAVLSSSPPINSTVFLVLLHKLGPVPVVQLKNESLTSSTTNITFRLPALPITDDFPISVSWRLHFFLNSSTYDTTTPDTIVTATDNTTSFYFRFASPPAIESATPSSLQDQPGIPPVVLLTGRFPISNKSSIQVNINNQTILPKYHILSMSTSHVALSLPRNLVKYPILSISTAFAINNVSSNTYTIPVLGTNGDNVILRSSILMSSQTVPSAPVLLPPSCGLQRAAVVISNFWENEYAGDSNSNDNKVYTFSIWRNDVGNNSGSLVEFARGPSHTALVPSRLLSTTSQSFTVLVVSSQNADSNSTSNSVVVFNTRPRSKTIGITTTRSLTADGNIAVDASFTSCLEPNGNQTQVLYEWFVNGTVVQDTLYSNLKTSKAIITNLGSGLLVAVDETPFRYSVNVRIVRENDSTLLTGSVHGYVGHVAPRLQKIGVVLNSGMKNLTSGISSPFEIYADWYGPQDNNVTLHWSCFYALSDAPCPPELLSDLITSNSTSAFNVTVNPESISFDDIFKYVVNISYVGNETLSASSKPLYVRFVEQEFTPVPSLTALSSASVIEEERGSFSFDFSCTERRLTIWRRDGLALGNLVDFRLFNMIDKLKQNDLLPAALINDDPYAWDGQMGSNTESSNNNPLLLTLDLSPISPGLYDLQAFSNINNTDLNVNSDTTPTFPCYSWSLNIRRCIRAARVYSVPVRWGIAESTIFYVSASSAGSEGQLFIFSLVRNNTEDLEQFISTEAETGTRNDYYYGDKSLIVATVQAFQQQRDREVEVAVTTVTTTFKIRSGTSGVFKIGVRVYDASGSTYLTSALSNTSITVQDTRQNRKRTVTNTTNGINTGSLLISSASIEQRLSTSLAWSDSNKFLTTLSALWNSSVDPMSISTKILDDSANALIQLSYHVSSGAAASDIIWASASLLLLHSSKQDELIAVVDRVTTLSLPHASSGQFLQPALQVFYMSALRTSASHKSAQKTFSAVLSTGLSCGKTRRATVTMGNEIDDYRVGKECFDGQIEAVDPTPVLYSDCNSSTSPNQKNTTVGHVLYIFMYQQHEDKTREETEQVTSEDVITGPVVGVRFLQRTILESNGTFHLQMSTAPRTGEECFWTQLAINISTERHNGVRFVKDSLRQTEEEEEEGEDDDDDGRELLCNKAGNITEIYGDDELRDIGKNPETQEVNNFIIRVRSYLQVSVLVERSSTVGSIQFSVNRTTLAACQRSLTVVGRHNGNQTRIVIAIVVSILLFILICVCCGNIVRHKERNNLKFWKKRWVEVDEEVWENDVDENDTPRIQGRTVAPNEAGRIRLEDHIGSAPTPNRETQRERAWRFGRPRGRGREVDNANESSADYVPWDATYSGVRVGENGALAMDDSLSMMRLAINRLGSTASRGSGNGTHDGNQRNVHNVNGNNRNQHRDDRRTTRSSVLMDDHNDDDDDSYSDLISMSSVGDYVPTDDDDSTTASGAADRNGMSDTDSDEDPNATSYLRDEFGRGEVEGLTHMND